MAGIDQRCQLAGVAGEIERRRHEMCIRDSSKVVVTEIDEKGRVNVSHRDLMEKPEGWDEEQRAKRAARDRRDGEKRVFRKREQ